MRIAYICADPGIPVFGCKGCSIHVQEVVRALIQQGHHVELFAVRIGGTAPSDLATVPVHKLPKPSNDSLVQREQALLALNLDVRFALEQAESFDLVYERYSLWSFTAMEFARNRGIPSILEVNAPLIEEQEQHRGLVHRVEADRVARRVFASAAVLVAVSDAVADYLKGYPQTQGKVHVIPNGVNPDRFPAQITPSLPSPVFTIGFVGTMKPWHGLPTLVDAFSQLHQAIWGLNSDLNDSGTSPVRLLIVGDGPERAQIEADLHDRHLESVTVFTGKVSPSDVPGLLASMDVAVAPYPQQDSFYFSPLKVYEYMAAGLPVVASRIGQLRALIDHGANGLLYTPGQSHELAHYLLDLYHHPQLRRQLGEEARTTVLRLHTWERVVQQMVWLAKHSIARNSLNMEASA